MNLLAFDTSTDTLSIAVQHGDGVWQHQGPGGAQASAALIPAFAIAALATACFVALSGVIGFVGLMVPHLARALCGALHGRLLVLSALAGAVLMLGSDLLCRTLLPPQELPIGIVTAALGGLFVVFL
eukprot:gene24946-45860_t